MFQKNNEKIKLYRKKIDELEKQNCIFYEKAQSGLT